MPEVNGFEPGLFCWAELSTSDANSAKSFYPTLFGWDVEDNEIPGGGVYTMYKLRGRYVGASSEQREDERSQGIPPHWNLYISTDDADGDAKRAEAAGGTVVAPAFDVMDAGRMAVIADPTGAIFGLWQSGQHRGFGLAFETGSVVWNELLTNDLDRATAFYTETFGWTAESSPTPTGTSYTVFRKGETQVAGAMANPEGMESMPPNWGVYYAVDDCDAIAARVKELGGSIYFGPQFMETVGKFATCADPQGAAFSILEPDMSAQSQ